jgi:hypothetical protein
VVEVAYMHRIDITPVVAPDLCVVSSDIVFDFGLHDSGSTFQLSGLFINEKVTPVIVLSL